MCMTAENRVRLCRLIEKINEQAEYSERIGIENASVLKTNGMTEKTEHRERGEKT